MIQLGIILFNFIGCLITLAFIKVSFGKSNSGSAFSGIMDGFTELIMYGGCFAFWFVSLLICELIYWIIF
jgi:hypothetical protein